MKITVVGAGNVGATCANVLAHRDAAHDIILIDIKPGLAEGKALDIWQSSPIDRLNCRINGFTDNYVPTANSDVVVITSGLPRKPGMSRDDLIETNATIVKSVTEQEMVDMSTEISDAIKKMGKHGLGHLVIMSQGRLRGIITKSDVMRFIKIRSELH